MAQYLNLENCTHLDKLLQLNYEYEIKISHLVKYQEQKQSLASYYIVSTWNLVNIYSFCANKLLWFEYKLKSCPCYLLNTMPWRYVGSGGRAPLIHDFSTRQRRWSASRSPPHKQSPQYPLDRRLAGWTPKLCGQSS